MKYLIICLFTVTTFFAQKEIDCEGFSKIVDDKYIITNLSGGTFDVGPLGVIDLKGNQLMGNVIKNQDMMGVSQIIFEDVVMGRDVEKDKKIAYDLITKKMIAEDYLYFSGFSEGINLMSIPYKVQKDNRFAIDRTNKRLFDLPRKIAYFGQFREGLALIGLSGENVYSDKKFVFIDTQGKEVININGHSGYGNFYEGLAVAEKTIDYKKYYGFIDKTGKEVIDLKYSKRPSAFSEGKSIVQTKDRKWGYMDKEGNVIIEPQYVFATGFYKNRALVSKGIRDWALIDENNQVIETYDFPSLSEKIKDKSPQQIERIKKFIDYNLLVVATTGYNKPDKLMQMDGSYLFEDKKDWTPIDFGKDYIIISTPSEKILGAKPSFVVNRKGEKVFVPKKNQF